MALIERVDTTMYAPRGPHRILVILGLVACSACQTRLTPDECAARSSELVRWLATVDQSAHVLSDADLSALDLATRDLPDRPTPAAPILQLGAKRTAFLGDVIADPAELKFRFDRFLLAQNGKRPPLALAIDRAVPWRRITDAFELAERAGFEQVELYFLAPVSPPPLPEKALDTADCPAVAEAFADPKTLGARIDPALRSCNCRVDPVALRFSVWTALANPHPIRVVRVVADRAGSMHVHPADARWAEVAATVQPGAGWLVAR
jgi:biopolymer transport protein ExbD